MHPSPVAHIRVFMRRFEALSVSAAGLQGRARWPCLRMWCGTCYWTWTIVGNGIRFGSKAPFLTPSMQYARVHGLVFLSAQV
jgi:hypothetical protein